MKTLKIFSNRRNSHIANTVKIYPFSSITNSSIDEYSYISYSCIINNCKIGKFCSIARGVKIGLGKHPINFISTSPLFYSPSNPLNIVLSEELMFNENESVLIGNDVWIGANVIILDGVTIGNGVIVAANSVVTKNVPSYSIVGGVPAKEIKKRFAENIVLAIETTKWWEMPIIFFRDKDVKSIFSKEISEDSICKLSEKIKTFNQL